TVDNTTLHNNDAGSSGGGLFMSVQGQMDGDVYITNDNITNNSSGYNGGGAAFQFYYQIGHGGTLTVDCTTFDSNSSDYNVCRLFFSYTGGQVDVLIEYSTFSYNYAGNDGGGLWVLTDDGLITIIEATFAYNGAGDDGGAIYVQSYTPDQLVQIYNS